MELIMTNKTKEVRLIFKGLTTFFPGKLVLQKQIDYESDKSGFE